jgi:serpin B
LRASSNLLRNRGFHIDYLGHSQGTTKSQMEKVLHFKLTKEQLNPAFASLNRRLIVRDQQQGLDLKVANRLWAQKGANFLPPFLKTTRDYYGAEVGQVDFIGQTEEARIAINTWVENQTLNHIKDLIPKNAVTTDTRLVLTNAIYFKGFWDSQFSKSDTREAPFTLKDKRIVEVPLMSQQGLFPYFDSGAFEVLGLPYKGGSLSFVIFLPKKSDGLNNVEKSLTEEELAGCISKMKIENVVVMIPRFNVELSFKLKEDLSAMGMPIAFHSGSANFSGMTGNTSLFISNVLHQSFLEVNEEGSKATAATAVVMEQKSVPKEPSIFRADHPFLFLIRDNRTGSLLFLGRLVNPQK